jgi:hypothetical protein
VLKVMHKNNILITTLKAKTDIGLYLLLLHYKEKEALMLLWIFDIKLLRLYDALMLLWIFDIKLLRLYDKLTSMLVQSFNLEYETRRRVLDIISRKSVHIVIHISLWRFLGSWTFSYWIYLTILILIVFFLTRINL